MDTSTRVNRPTMWKGPGMANRRTPDGSDHDNRNRNRMQRPGGGSSGQIPEDEHEALVKCLKISEITFAGMFLSARMISFTSVVFLVGTIGSIETTSPPPSIYTVILSQFSPVLSSPPAPYQTAITATSPPSTFDASSSRSIIRMNVHFVAALVFSNSATFLAMVGKRMARDRRDRLVLLGRRRRMGRAAQIRRFYVEERVMSEAVMRLHLVALVLFSLAFVNITASVGLTSLVVIVLCGLRYVCGVVGQASVRYWTSAPIAHW